MVPLRPMMKFLRQTFLMIHFNIDNKIYKFKLSTMKLYHTEIKIKMKIA